MNNYLLSGGTHMKMLFWNICEGCKNKSDMQNPSDPALSKLMSNGRDRENTISKWIEEQRPDVVALLELQGFSNSRLQHMASRWNHPHHLLLQGSFPMAITSTYPLRRPSWIIQDMTHGLISVDIEHIQVMLCHIPPKKYTKYNDRCVEYRQLLPFVLPRITMNLPLLFLGDLNAPMQDDLVSGLRALGLLDSIADQSAERTDYVLHNAPLQSHIRITTFAKDTVLHADSNIRMYNVSDHTPIIVQISTSASTAVSTHGK